MDEPDAKRMPLPLLVDDTRLYTVVVTTGEDDSGGLLRLASVFHRRRVDILHASYSAAGPHRWLVATVEATEPRLRTLTMSLRNAVGVTACEVVAHDDDESLEPALVALRATSPPAFPSFLPR